MSRMTLWYLASGWTLAKLNAARMPCHTAMVSYCWSIAMPKRLDRDTASVEPSLMYVSGFVRQPGAE